MLLHVMYTDGTYDLVKDFTLSALIENSKVLRLKRSTGWVDIKSPDVRRTGRDNNYNGPERRRI